MTSNNNHYESLIKLLLPPEIFEYFETTDLHSTGSEVHVSLDEQNVLPEGYDKDKLTSKGFHKPATIQDFPLRDKAMYLHVRRRRWQDETTGKAVSRDWESVAEGTRLTKEFATFLKEISRHIRHKQ